MIVKNTFELKRTKLVATSFMSWPEHKKYTGCYWLKSQSGADYLGYVRREDGRIAIYYGDRFKGFCEYQAPIEVIENQQKSNVVKSLIQRLTKIEAQLDRIRGASPLSHGWQTQKLARAQRSWDVLAQERTELRDKLAKFGVEV